MPTVIMPKMGDGMEEGTLLRWLKQVGEEVDEGDPIAEIETDKVTIEIEASEGGVLTQTLVGEGQTVPIGTAIATIGAAGETVAAGSEPATAATNGSMHASTEVGAEDEPTAKPAADAPVAPPAASGQGAATAAANGSAGVAPEPAVSRAPGERLRASPLVKRLAVEHGLDLQQIAGSGPGGRIVKDDVMPYLTGARVAPATPAPARAPETLAPAVQAAAPAPAPATAPPPQPAVAATGRLAGVPREMSRIRKTTGKRMAEAKDVIPHFYVSSNVDMTAAIAFRDQVNRQLTDDASKVSFNDLIVKAAALALREFPNLNATLEGDQLYDHPNVDINIAVAIEGGLIAPFVPDADQKSLGTIARMAKDLVKRAREGGLQPDEYHGGTFTISNLGMYDVAEFVAIINPPQAAILAIGSITETPVVTDGQATIGHRMKITLSADHRVTDGAEVARFLMVVKKYLQNPMLLALS